MYIFWLKLRKSTSIFSKITLLIDRLTISNNNVNQFRRYTTFGTQVVAFLFGTHILELFFVSLAQIAEEAGIPNGVFNVIPSDRENTAEISKFLCNSPDVDVISFTGTAAVSLHRCCFTVYNINFSSGSPNIGKVLFLESRCCTLYCALTKWSQPLVFRSSSYFFISDKLYHYIPYFIPIQMVNLNEIYFKL